MGEGAAGDLLVGDRVAAYLSDGGGYAEYAVVPAAFAFPLPDALDLRTGGGAALVLAGAARLAPGDTVLIHAAAGGVGGVAAQLARALGARAVYGTVITPEKAEYARTPSGTPSRRGCGRRPPAVVSTWSWTRWAARPGRRASTSWPPSACAPTP